MEWLEITIDVPAGGIDALTLGLELLGVEGLVIEDEADFLSFLENNRKYWDYVDEELLSSRRGVSRVRFYLEPGAAAESLLRSVEELEPVRSGYSRRTVCDEDWENSWKQYYRPVEVGESFVIVPEWEEIPGGGRIAIRLDPGLSFGTGSHPTTQMCLAAMEGLELSSARVLDLGCGSGILSIAALLTGAGAVTACDIDPVAERVARENAALNGVEGGLEVVCGDVLSDRRLRERLSREPFDLVLANIVADVILELIPGLGNWLKSGGIFICSGIIEGRQDEIRGMLKNPGMELLAEQNLGEWYGFTARRMKEG